MKDTSADLLAEYRELAELAQALTPEQWQASTAFHGWTPWDEIAHLCYFDETALQSATDPDAFARDAMALGASMARGEAISAVARARYGKLDGPALAGRWRDTFEDLVAVLSQLDPKARLPWYGPPMSALSFASARLMETWAHGQDVWDLLRRKRPATARLKHIAHIGVTTFGWTFANRKLPVPAVQALVELAAPGGGVWTWGDPASADFVRGPAEDFCLLVTQRRHLDDTGLEYSAGAMQQWLSMAQCFAGPPADGPPPGVRVVRD